MDLTEWLAWPAVKDIVVAFIGSAAGAVGGAFGAQWISDRAKVRDVVRKDVVRTNLAIELLHLHMTRFLNLKEQFTVPLMQEYQAARTIVVAFEQGRANGTIPPGTPPPQLPAMNMYSMYPQEVRIERLERVVMDDLTVTGRARALVMILGQSINALDSLLKDRERLLNGLRTATGGGPLQRQHVLFIFGLPRDGGSTDAHFKTNVEGIESANNECIHFIWLLYKDLRAHGQRARADYRRRFRDPIPEISDLDFAQARQKGLFPNPAPFESWETGFLMRVPSTRGRRLRKAAYWVQKMYRRVAKRIMRSQRFQSVWRWLKRLVAIGLSTLLLVMIFREIARAIIPLWQRIWP